MTKQCKNLQGGLHQQLVSDKRGPTGPWHVLLHGSSRYLCGTEPFQRTQHVPFPDAQFSILAALSNYVLCKGCQAEWVKLMRPIILANAAWNARMIGYTGVDLDRQLREDAELLEKTSEPVNRKYRSGEKQHGR